MFLNTTYSLIDNVSCDGSHLGLLRFHLVPANCRRTTDLVHCTQSLTSRLHWGEELLGMFGRLQQILWRKVVEQNVRIEPYLYGSKFV